MSEKRKYKTIELSTDVYERLCGLETKFASIFKLKNVSHDKFILWLIESKIDYADLLLLYKMHEEGKKSLKSIEQQQESTVTNQNG